MRSVARAASGEGRGGGASLQPIWNSWGLVGPDPIAFVDVEGPVVRLCGKRRVVRRSDGMCARQPDPTSSPPPGSSSDLNPNNPRALWPNL